MCVFTWGGHEFFVGFLRLRLLGVVSLGGCFFVGWFLWVAFLDFLMFCFGVSFLGFHGCFLVGFLWAFCGFLWALWTFCGCFCGLFLLAWWFGFGLWGFA